MCLLGAAGGLGHYLLALAHRYAPSSVIAPFVYQQVIYMALFGYLVFGDVPGPLGVDRGGDRHRQRPLPLRPRTDALSG